MMMLTTIIKYCNCQQIFYTKGKFPVQNNQLLELSVNDTGTAKLDMDDTERVVESEVCDVALLAGTDI